MGKHATITSTKSKDLDVGDLLILSEEISYNTCECKLSCHIRCIEDQCRFELIYNTLSVRRRSCIA